jgi:hypothetical protein
MQIWGRDVLGKWNSHQFRLPVLFVPDLAAKIAGVITMPIKANAIKRSCIGNPQFAA